MSESIWGETLNHTVNQLASLVRENQRPGIVVVEVGVWRGDTALLWLPTVKAVGGKGILIDWFKGTPEENALPGTGVPYDPNPRIAELRCHDLADRLGAAGFDDICEIWMADSWRAARELTDESCDIIFIDADHRYDYVKTDIINYRPKVKPGGILCGHDFSSFAIAITDQELVRFGYYEGHHWGVDLAVTETFGIGGVEVLPDSVWAWRKPV